MEKNALLVAAIVMALSLMISCIDLIYMMPRFGKMFFQMFQCDSDLYAADSVADLIVCATFTSKANKIYAIKNDNKTHISTEYPTTKLLFNNSNNIFATTGDFLRIYQYEDSNLELKALLRNIRRVGQVLLF